LIFIELKKFGHQLCELVGIRQPGREEQGRSQLFVGWLNGRHALFEAFLCNLTVIPAMFKPTRCRHDSTVDRLILVFSEGDSTFDETLDKSND
jgi:hypothetical protein